MNHECRFLHHEAQPSGVNKALDSKVIWSIHSFQYKQSIINFQSTFYHKITQSTILSTRYPPGAVYCIVLKVYLSRDTSLIVSCWKFIFQEILHLFLAKVFIYFRKSSKKVLLKIVFQLWLNHSHLNKHIYFIKYLKSIIKLKLFIFVMSIIWYSHYSL